MKKISVCYIISNVNKAVAYEWISQRIDKNEFALRFILLNPGDSELEDYLRTHGFTVNRILYRGKKDILRGIWGTINILRKQKIDVVHAHLFDANIIGITAAWVLRIKKRIYTRHHSNFHHVYYPKAVKYDKFVNALSTDIIAISNNVENILTKLENVPRSKIHLIHHGFELTEFKNVPPSNIHKLREKYNFSDSAPVVGVISRYIQWKGIHYTVAAFEKFIVKYPNAVLVLANARGDYKSHIQKLLKSIPEKNYVEIPFESDVFSLYKLFDLFVHVPVDSETEAFGQTYIEALAAGVPSIFTLSGIANEFIIDKRNALVVPFQNPEAIYNAMITMVENADLRTTLVTNGEKDVFAGFNLSKMISSLEQVYSNSKIRVNQTSNTFFSIIIPTYNRASFILKTIHSVLNQTFQNFEIIVVDDGSTDNTEDIIRDISSEKIRYFKIKNSERGYARNYGMMNSKGDYVTFLDSDDLLFSDYFSNANESIQRYSKPPFLHLAYQVVNPDDNVLLKIDCLKSDDINFLIKGNSLSCTGCFLRNDVAQTLRFNEDRDLSGSEDWELWFRVLANHGIKTDNRISAKIINHSSRSVLLSLGNEEKLVLRKELALKYAFRDKCVQAKYGKHFKKIDAFGDSYIALHLALTGNSRRSMYYLIKSLKAHPQIIFSKRFLVILKYILLKMI